LSGGLSRTGAVSVNDPFEKYPFENIPSMEPQNTVSNRRRSLPTLPAFDDPFAALDDDNAFEASELVSSEQRSRSFSETLDPFDGDDDDDLKPPIAALWW
jgi:hypothetical protein